MSSGFMSIFSYSSAEGNITIHFIERVQFVDLLFLVLTKGAHLLVNTEENIELMMKKQ